MSADTSFWQRIGNFFRSEDADEPLNGNGTKPKNGVPKNQPDDQHPVASADNENAGDMPRSSSSLMRWTRNQPSTGEMRAGYQRVLELMDDMHQHFEKHDHRAEQLANSVDRVAGILERLAQTQHQQGECIRTIADNVESASRHAVDISKSLHQVPESLRTQADTVRTLVQQMEVTQECDNQLMHSLQQLGKAVEALSSASTAQVRSLEDLHHKEEEQRDALTDLVRSQNRNYLIVVIVAAVIAVGALAALVVPMLLNP